MLKLNRPILITVIAVLLAACSPATSEPPPTLAPTIAPPTTIPTATLVAATDTPTAPTNLGPTTTPPFVPETHADDPADQSFLRVIHASPDSPIIDVYVELLAVATNLSFTGNTGRINIVAGDYMLRVVPSGKLPTDTPLLEEPLSIPSGQSLILVFTGIGDAVALKTFGEAIGPLDRAQSRLNFINAVPGAGDLKLKQGDGDLTPPLAFAQSSNPIILNSGLSNFTVQSGDTSLLTQNVNIRERHTHTMVVVGRVDDLRNAKLLEFSSQVPGRTSIRLINASVSIGPVDLYLNNDRLVDDATFGRASERQSVPNSVYQAALYAAGADAAAIEPLTSTQLRANPDDVITLIVVGPPEDLRLITHREDLSATPPEQARIAFVNTLETVPRLQIELEGGPVEGVEPLAYGQVSPEVLFDSGTFTLYSNKYENGEMIDVVEIADNVLFEAGRRYLYLVTGQIDSDALFLSDNVGIDPRLRLVEGDDSELVEPVPGTEAQIRVINAITNREFLDMLVDDEVVVPGQGFGEASDLITIDGGAHVFTVRPAQTTELLGRLEVDLLPDTAYTLVVMGSETFSVELLLVTDSDLVLGDDKSHLRLINISQNGDVRFGLAQSPPAEAVSPGAEDSVEDGEVNYRTSLQFGGQRLIDNVLSRQSSPIATVPSQMRNLQVIDAERLAIAAIIAQVDLQPGRHYDVIAFQQRDSLRVEAFVIAYPAP